MFGEGAATRRVRDEEKHLFTPHPALRATLSLQERGMRIHVPAETRSLRGVRLTIMRNTFCVLVLALAFSGSQRINGAVQSGTSVVPPAKKVTIEDFGERVNAYVRLRRDNEDSFTALTSSSDSAEIASHKI